MAKRENVLIKKDDKEILIPKYKQKTTLDHFMILLGVVCAILAFVLVFDVLYEPSVLGLIFDKESYDNYYSHVTGKDSTSSELSSVEEVINDLASYRLGDIEEEINSIKDSGEILVINGSKIDKEITDKEFAEMNNITVDQITEQQAKSLINHNAAIQNINNLTEEKDQINKTVEVVTGKWIANISYSINNKIFDDGLQTNGTWFPTLVYTLFFVACLLGLAWLLVYYIRDYIEVARSIIVAVQSIKKGFSGSMKDVFYDFEKEDIKVKKSEIIEGINSSIISKGRKKKEIKEKKFIPTDTGEFSVSQTNQKKKRRKDNSSTNIENSITNDEEKEKNKETTDISEEMLNSMLTAPDTDISITETDDDYKPKSLFSDDD